MPTLKDYTKYCLAIYWNLLFSNTHMINKQLVQTFEDFNTEILAFHKFTLVGVILLILYLVSDHIFDVCHMIVLKWQIHLTDDEEIGQYICLKSPSGSHSETILTNFRNLKVQLQTIICSIM